MTSVQNYKGLKLFSHRIDEQLCEILGAHLSRVLEEVESGIAEKLKPETQAVVMLVYYLFSMVMDRPTPGMLAMNLTFLLEKNDPNNAFLESNKSGFNNSGFSSYFNVIASGASILSNMVLNNNEKDNITGGKEESENKNNNRHNMNNTNTSDSDTNSTGNASVNFIRKYKVYRVCLLLVYVLTIWALNRMKRTALMEGWRSAPEGSRKKKLWKLLNILEFVTKISDITNICTFFLRGVYPTLLYRIMGAKTVPIITTTSTMIGTLLGTDNIPGYSSPQLYVRSRQLLWLVLSGVLGSSSVTLDYRSALQMIQNSIQQIVSAVGQVTRNSMNSVQNLIRPRPSTGRRR